MLALKSAVISGEVGSMLRHVDPGAAGPDSGCGGIEPGFTG